MTNQDDKQQAVNIKMKPVVSTFLELFSKQAINYPDHVAIAYGSETITYSELYQRVNRFSNLMIAHGIQRGDTVGLAPDRSIGMVGIMLAIMKAGAAYVPLDPNFPIDRLNFMLADSGAKLLITPKNYDSYFQTDTKKMFLEDVRAQISAYSPEDPEVSLNLVGDDLAYILYTSGSTGKPKGVQISHHNLLNLLRSIQTQPGITADDIWLAVATISFDIAGLELFLPLMTGAKLIVADSDTVKDGRLLLETIRKEKVSVMQATPYTWRMMLASGWEDKLPIKALCGGEAMPRDLADKLTPRCNELWNLYGPTETTIYSTGKQIKVTDKIITIGKPIANTQVYIVDERLNFVPVGQEGEICIGGEGVSQKGYLNRPELTAEKFIADPFVNEPGAKLYRTGDLGKIMPNGEINYLGRIDNQVKIRGYRIETGEIEYNLMQQDNVKNAVVVVHEDELSNQHLVAYIVKERAPTQITDTAKNKSHFKKWSDTLKRILPEYMVPTDFVLITEFPLTPSGKIDRKALPKPKLQGITTDYLAPESEMEMMIATTWSKYLGKDKIGIHDNFFELGGHSLIAVQIMTMISKTTGKLLPIATLFKYPTIYKLARLIGSDDEDSTWKSLVPIKPQGSKMPVYIVHGEGLNVLIFNNIAMNVDAEQPVYGLQSRGLNGKDDVPDSIEAIAKLYIDEIIEQNPTGPYAIAGYSFGGYVAIEMAKQLQDMGKEVKMLAMLDANFKKPLSQMSLPRLVFDKSLRQVRKLLFIAGTLIKQPKTAIAYQKFMIRSRLQPWGLYQEIDPENVPEYMQRIVDKLRYAVSQYRIAPYNGIINVFRSQTRLYFLDDPKYLGWGKYALKGVKVFDVQGDHRDMLLPPNDKDFAQKLQQCLDESFKTSLPGSRHTIHYTSKLAK